MNLNERHSRPALLVDYGGVLTTSVRDSFRAFCEAESITGAQFMAAVFAGPGDGPSPVEKVETGALSAADFDTLVAARLSDACGRAIEARDLKTRMFAGVRPDAAMRTAVAAARAAGIPTVLVSNSWGGDDYPLEELAPLFDEMLISGHIGLRKPEPEIYLLAAERAGVTPEACIFIDDLAHNVEGAARVGMQGVLHRVADETVALLERALGLPLRGRAG